MPRAILTVAGLLLASPALAGTLEVQPVSEHAYALVGPMGQRSPENLGNNATFGVIVTPAGVVLVDAGGSWRGAADIDATIDSITDQPVVVVINSGGQDHRWLGNGYWKAQGARLIASAAAIEDQKARVDEQMFLLERFLGDALAGTAPVYAEETFADQMTLSLGGMEMQIIHPGPAHTPGDSFVWLPSERVAFAGDIVFNERILGVQPHSDVRNWIASFEAMAALGPEWVVPGHGHAGPLARAMRDTHDYLVNLRQQIGALIENGGDIHASTAIDQSAFAYLGNFKVWAGKNAQQTYEQMEWE